MAFRAFHPVANQLSFQNRNSFRILRKSWYLPCVKYLHTLLLITASLSSAQETSGFKPVNGDVTKSTEGNSEKATEFITFKNPNPNQRINLLQPSNNSDSSPQPYQQDYYTRGLPNYIGGANSIQGNSLNGLFPSNIDPFAQAGVGQGISFPNGSPFPPSFPFQGLGGAIPPGVTGLNQNPLGGFVKPPAFPSQGIPPQFQFNRPHNLNPSGGPIPGGHFPHSHSAFPVQGYPHTHTSHTHPYPVGNGISNLYFGLPRQIKVPGRIEITLHGNDAEITCEFPRFLILIQRIYWHHRYHDGSDPYGSYYDSNNGFGPRVTVHTADKWKSILTIHEFNEDDYGTYRCFTTAVLPDESSTQHQHLQQPDFNQGFLRSPSTTTENTIPSPEYLRRIQLPKTSNRQAKDMRVSNNGVSRKVRFTRSAGSSTTANSLISELVTKLKAKRQLMYGDQNPKTQNTVKTGTSVNDLSKQASQEIYDPYYYNQNNYFGGIGGGQQHDPTERNFYLPNPFGTSSPLPPAGTTGPAYNPHINQNSRYNPFSAHSYPYAPQNSNGYGPYASFYKPAYGLFTIYQEIKFAPTRRSFIGSASSSSPPTVA